MQTPSEPFTLYDRGWIVRIQPPTTPPPHRVLLMLHGWTGDETVMWIFARNLPKDYWIFAPRAPHPANSSYGGYSWSMRNSQDPPTQIEVFSPVAQNILSSLQVWMQERKIGGQPVNLMGFSQGAALSYTLLIEHAAQIGSVAALAGMLPVGAEERLLDLNLTGKRVLISHGTRDTTIPVERARAAAKALDAAGADVTYCEDDTGHKLGAGCHKALAAFFA